MCAKSTVVSFIDLPPMERVTAAIDGWRRPALLEWWCASAPEILAVAHSVNQKLSAIRSRRKKSRLESEVIDWLYKLIRANIKRGRVFELDEVLRQNRADCLGYVKLLALLGRWFGLDIGVVDVVVDNAGRYVPHAACLLKLSDGRRRTIDLWYGSPRIRHRRLGLRVRRDGAWSVEDRDRRELAQEEVSYLPDSCVNAITLYVRGNRHLSRGEFDRAVECYSAALDLYPQNARLYYNRAVAYEKQAEYERARADYAQAFRDKAAVTRVLARDYDEITGLIELDAVGIDSRAQDIYLLFRGLITGRRVPPAEIARRLGVSEPEVEATLSGVKAKLSKSQIST